MSRGDRFSSRVRTVQEAPEPFRGVLLGHLSVQESARLLVYGPPDHNLSTISPGTLLAVTERGWVTVYEHEDGTTAVAEASFRDTLLVQLTLILLYGQLRLDYWAGGAVRSAMVRFNTVMAGLYEEAAFLVLDGIDSVSHVSEGDLEQAVALVAGWPLKFLNAALRSLPRGQQLLEATHWLAVHGRFGRELAPAAALLLTDRAVILVSEEKATWRMRFGNRTKYGDITTYLPLRRLRGFSVSQQERLHVLELQVGAPRGQQTLEAPLPPETGPAASQLMDSAMRRVRQTHAHYAEGRS